MEYRDFQKEYLEDIGGEVCMEQTMLGFGDMLMILCIILKGAKETTERLRVTQSNCIIQHDYFSQLWWP